MIVIKRDGKKVDFDVYKIKQALIGANSRSQEMSDSDIDRITEIILNKCNKVSGDLKVEDIQDIVEDTLLESEFTHTAKTYILYRDKRTRIRQGKSKLLKEVGNKLMGVHIVNQNANVDERSFGGRKGEADSVLTKQYALDYCMSEKSRNNHLNNEIYIHDLDSYAVGMHNCLSIPFDKLLAEGFNTRQTDVRPAASINTAFQLVAVIFQLQSLQQFGGVSATHLDWTMVPYVRKSFLKHYNELTEFIPFCKNKKLALDYIVSPMARKNHEENMIYIHDLDNYYVGSHNCLSIPFDELLANGFNTRQTDVRPAGSVSTAFQLVAVIFQLQSLQQFGGVSATHLDWTMVPYVRKSFYKHYKDGLKYIEEMVDHEIESEFPINFDPTTKPIGDNVFWRMPKAFEYAHKMTEKEVHQAVEGLYHNLNTLQSRSGNQLN